jgi:hypothetical protein
VTRYLFAWAGGWFMIYERPDRPLVVVEVAPVAGKTKTITGLIYHGLAVIAAWKEAGKPGLVVD